MNPALTQPDVLAPQNPWPGLRAFTEAERDYFFGREVETAALLALVRRSEVVVFYGQSGLGKTSLLQAGLFPELKRLDLLPLRVRFDHGQDAPPLARQLLRALYTELARAGVTAPPPGAEETLWEYFHRRDVEFWGPRNRLLTPVVVLDQFEEVFTLGQKDAASAARVTAFRTELEALLEKRPPAAVRERLEADPEGALRYHFQQRSVKLVLSLREDFLPHLDTWRAQMPSLLPNRFRLERLSGIQALEVVVRADGELVTSAVAREIVEFVSTSQRRKDSARPLEERAIEPALLCVVCDELNRRRLDLGQPQILPDILTHERAGIILGFYERAFDGVDTRVRDWVESELLTSTGYRDRAALEDALKLGLPADAFDLLENRRLLHREERDSVVWLELTHDLLSDPAAHSRQVRQQRLAAEAAALREAAVARNLAEVHRRLKRSRLTTAVFGLLLLLAFAAMLYANAKRHLAVEAQEKTQAALREAQLASEQADEMAALALLSRLTDSKTNKNSSDIFVNAADSMFEAGKQRIENRGKLTTSAGILMTLVNSSGELEKALSLTNSDAPAKVNLAISNLFAIANIITNRFRTDTNLITASHQFYLTLPAKIYSDESLRSNVYRSLEISIELSWLLARLQPTNEANTSIAIELISEISEIGSPTPENRIWSTRLISDELQGFEALDGDLKAEPVLVQRHFINNYYNLLAASEQGEYNFF